MKRKLNPHEKVARHHATVAYGLLLIAASHVLFPIATEYVSLAVSLLWVGDPSSNLDHDI